MTLILVQLASPSGGPIDARQDYSFVYNGAPEVGTVMGRKWPHA